MWGPGPIPKLGCLQEHERREHGRMPPAWALQEGPSGEGGALSGPGLRGDWSLEGPASHGHGHGHGMTPACSSSHVC